MEEEREPPKEEELFIFDASRRETKRLIKEIENELEAERERVKQETEMMRGAAMWKVENPRAVKRKLSAIEYTPTLHSTITDPYMLRLPLEMMHAIFTQLNPFQMLKFTQVQSQLRQLKQFYPFDVNLGTRVSVSETKWATPLLEEHQRRNIVGTSLFGDILLYVDGYLLAYSYTHSSEAVCTVMEKKLLTGIHFSDIPSEPFHYLTTKEATVYWVITTLWLTNDTRERIQSLLGEEDLEAYCIMYYIGDEVGFLNIPFVVYFEEHEIACSNGAGIVVIVDGANGDLNVLTYPTTSDTSVLKVYKLNEYMPDISFGTRDYRFIEYISSLGGPYFLIRPSSESSDVTYHILIVKIDASTGLSRLFHFNLPATQTLSAATLLWKQYLLMAFSLPIEKRGFIDVLSLDSKSENTIRIGIPQDVHEKRSIQFLTTFKSALILGYAETEEKETFSSIRFYDLLNSQLRTNAVKCSFKNYELDGLNIELNERQISLIHPTLAFIDGIVYFNLS